MTVRTFAPLTIALAVSATLSLAAGCGVNTNASAALASPTPTGATPTPTNVVSPTPTAMPTPTSGASGTCSFVWATSYVNIDGTYDLFEVDIDATQWNNSTTTLDGVKSVAYFLVGYNPTDGSIYVAGETTSGAIALNVGNTTMGSAAGFTGTASHNFFDATALYNGTSTALGGPIATGGTGSFTGVLSDPNPAAAITPGTGSMSATDTGSTTETFGGNATPAFDYAVCTP